MHEVNPDPHKQFETMQQQFKMMYELQTAQLVLLERIYDVSLALLTDTNEELANQVYEEHENGRTLGPDIWIARDDSDSDTDESQQSQ